MFSITSGWSRDGWRRDEFQRLARWRRIPLACISCRPRCLEAQERRADAEKEYAAALDAQTGPAGGAAGTGEAPADSPRLRGGAAACTREPSRFGRRSTAAYGLGVCHSYLQNDRAGREAVRAGRAAESIGRGRVGRPGNIARETRAARPMASRSCSAPSPSRPTWTKLTTCSAWPTRPRATPSAPRKPSRRPSSCAAPGRPPP